MTLFSNVFPESRYHGKITPQYFIILCIFKAHHHKYISSFLLLYVLSDFNFNFKNILNLFFGVKKDTLYLCIKQSLYFYFCLPQQAVFFYMTWLNNPQRGISRMAYTLPSQRAQRRNIHLLIIFQDFVRCTYSTFLL